MKRVVGLYYGYQIFFSLLFWLPIFYEYQRQSGLNDAQIFAIQSIYYIVFCFLEIPTGMAADRWGHRLCLRWASVVLVFSNLLPIFLPTYPGFLWHFLLIAAARSLNSGASSAYLYDYLGEHGALRDYKQIEGNARAYGLVGKIVCWVFIGTLMKWHFTLPYWLTVAAALVSALYAWALPRLRFEMSQVVKTPLLPKLVSIAQILKGSPVLVLLMLQGIAVFVLGRILQVNLFQPILSAKHFDLSYYGIIMSMMTVFEALGSGRPGWIRKWLDDLNAVFLTTAAMALSLCVIPAAGSVLAAVSLCFFSYAAGLAFPIQRQLLNDAIPDSRYRATLLSVESILDRAACAWAAGMIGSYLQMGKLDLFLVLSAVASLALMGILIIVVRIAEVRPAHE